MKAPLFGRDPRGARGPGIRAGVFFFVLLLAACGYRFVGRGGFPGGVEHVFVQALENKSSFTGIENLITRELLTEFVLRQENHLANSRSEADAVLSGAVTNAAIRTVSPSSSDTARERRITVWIDLKLARTNGEILWKAGDLSDYEEYRTTPDKQETEILQRRAIARIGQRLAERALNLLTENF